ncbi:hypothetical protein FRX31_016711 [Thalictrum thalictroides]|uniref:Uncharacterized protein n=1 Tax=Thalictrum thalictroides TaxID=46969 RepID=A0A7J6W9R7_THATH|nr:hypothetical protein FRX31_016711 [Thalictrum thalictroides]
MVDNLIIRYSIEGRFFTEFPLHGHDNSWIVQSVGVLCERFSAYLNAKSESLLNIRVMKEYHNKNS